MAARSAEILDLWERGRCLGPVDRGIRLLAVALPAHDVDHLADLDLGLRDWHLLRLRRDLFGTPLAGYIDCPCCHERLEIELDARALQENEPPASPPVYVSRDGRRFRLPNSRDLAAVAAGTDSSAAAQHLFERCSMDECPSAEDHALDRVLEEVDAGLEALAAQRGVHLNLSCGICGGRWRHFFDPGEFLWEEIEAHAAVLLDDVHRLASAYGWPERDILAMSEARRDAYLSRVD